MSGRRYGSRAELRERERGEEAGNRDKPDEIVRAFEGLRNHRLGKHGQNCARGHGADRGDYLGREADGT